MSDQYSNSGNQSDAASSSPGRGNASSDQPTALLNPNITGRPGRMAPQQAASTGGTGPSSAQPRSRTALVLLAGAGTLGLLVIMLGLYLLLRSDPGFTLLVQGAPPNSVVFVDSVRRGVPTNDGAIRVSWLKPGAHLLRVTSEGFTDFPASVSGEHGQTKTVIAQMIPGGARRTIDAPKQQQLSSSLSAILETRREDRGLIVNLPDVSFDTGQAALKPAAREKLAKVAGILLAYPENTLQVEGHTDAQGSDESNVKLSQARANAVRDFLVQSGLSLTRITATRGFGKTKPVATNDTAEGRQKNRRVEIVIVEPGNRG